MSSEHVEHPDQAAFLRFIAHLHALRASGTIWPSAPFEALIGLMAHCSWEIVPTRTASGRQQFLYTLRSAQDTAYPPDPVLGRRWYFAGSFNRGEPLSAGLSRVGGEDLRQVGRLVYPKLAGVINWFKEKRGPTVGLVFRCEYVGEAIPPDTQWLDWDQPPQPMIECHRILVERLIHAIRDGETAPWYLEDPR